MSQAQEEVCSQIKMITRESTRNLTWTQVTEGARRSTCLMLLLFFVILLNYCNYFSARIYCGKINVGDSVEDVVDGAEEEGLVVEEEQVNLYKVYGWDYRKGICYIGHADGIVVYKEYD